MSSASAVMDAAILPQVAPAALCVIHGIAKRYRYRPTIGRGLLVCRECDIARKRRDRASLRSSRLGHLTSRLANCDSERALSLADALARSCGGWERLLAELPQVERARLAVRLSDVADDLRVRAQSAEEAEKVAAQSGAKDPLVIAAAVELLLQLSAAELRPVVERLILKSRTKRARQLTGDGDGV